MNVSRYYQAQGKKTKGAPKIHSNISHNTLKQSDANSLLGGLWDTSHKNPRLRARHSHDETTIWYFSSINIQNEPYVLKIKIGSRCSKCNIMPVIWRCSGASTWHRARGGHTPQCAPPTLSSLHTSPIATLIHVQKYEMAIKPAMYCHESKMRFRLSAE